MRRIIAVVMITIGFIFIIGCTTTEANTNQINSYQNNIAICLLEKREEFRKLYATRGMQTNAYEYAMAASYAELLCKNLVNQVQ